MSQSEKVYLVDDDASVRKGLGRLLRAAGYDVQVLASAEAFLSLLPIESGGCAILDARMPGLSGTSLQDAMREQGTDIPVIFVTAEDDEKTRERARFHGAAAFFHKPVDGQALIDAIEWALEKHTNNGPSQ